MPGTDEQMRDVVRDGAKVFLRIEDLLDKVFVAINALERPIMAGYTLEMMGGLQTMKLLAEVHAIAGDAMRVKANIACMHRECTDIAIAKGVDIPEFTANGLVKPAGGGSR